MVKTGDYITEVGKIVQELEALGLCPVLVGGMAMVIRGSRRVTRDFDFLISGTEGDKKALTEIFYKSGLKLASKMDADGDITRTIDNAKIAAARLRLDAPESAHFLNRQTGLKIDLLFDFPLPARELFSRAEVKKIRTYTFRIACKRDLVKLKTIAHRDRASAADAQDLEFLKKEIILFSG